MSHFKSHWLGVLSFFAGFLFLTNANAQTIIHTFGTPTSCAPPPVTFSFDPGGVNFNFNAGALPTGWSSGTGSFTVGQEPCAAPSLSGTPFFWASTSTGTPQIITGDVNTASGGTISFDMRYAVQGGATPCEGPDEPDEGVTLQYSTNGGATWTNIDYWDTGGGAAGARPYTGNWVSMSMPIPAAAQTCSTRFRWIQFNSSGSCCDNWGLDEIEIAGSGAGAVSCTLVWDFGDGSPTVTGSNPTHQYTAPGIYSVTVSYNCTGTGGCGASVGTATKDIVVSGSDNTPPVIANCPANITINADPTNCDVAATWTPPTATDNCSFANLTSSHAPGDVFPLGITTVTYTATDASGNTANCNFDVTVVDVTAPAFQNCPANITQVSAVPLIMSWTTPTATDNCGGSGGSIVTGVAVEGPLVLSAPFTTPMGVAYNAALDVYYTGYGGFTSRPILTHDNTGAVIANTPNNLDIRGIWWDSNTATVGANGYNANGYKDYDLNGSGHALSTGVTNPMGSNQPNAQSQGALDPTANEVLFYDNGQVYRYDRATGTQLSNVAITGLPVAMSNLNMRFCGYSGIAGSEIIVVDHVLDRVYFIDKTTGAYQGFVQLPSVPLTGTWNVGYANGHLWIHSSGAWRQYKIVNQGSVTVTQIAGPTSGATFPVGTTSIVYLATDAAGNTSTCTFDVTVRPPNPPSPPVPAAEFIAAYAQDTARIEVKWLHSWPDEQGFYLYRAIEGGDYLQIAVVPPGNDTIRYMDTGLEADTQYHYYVRAYKGTRTSTHSDQAEDITFPHRPTLVDITTACYEGRATATVTAPHRGGNYRWYETVGRENPLLGAAGIPHEEPSFTTPFLRDTLNVYVRAAGRRYESFPLEIQFKVNERPNATLLSSPSILSCGGMETLEAQATPGATYQWLRNGVEIPGATNATYDATENGVYSLYVWSDLGCRSLVSEDIHLTLNYEVEVFIEQGASALFCDQGTLSATDLSGVTYEWVKSGNILGTNRTLDVTENGTYELHATENGCTVIREIDVVFSDFPTDLSLTSSGNDLCPGEAVTLTAPSFNGNQYRWFLNGQFFTLTDVPTLETGVEGTYEVQLLHRAGCERTSASFTLNVNNIPEMRIAQRGNTLELLIPDGNTPDAVTWYLNDVAQPNLSGTFIEPTEEGVYHAEPSFNGCTDLVGGKYFVFVVTGIENEDLDEDRLLIYPNPTPDALFVQLPAHLKGKRVSLKLFDAQGRMVKAEIFEGAETQQTLSLNLRHLAQGSYMLRIEAQGAGVWHKVIRE